MHSIACGYYWWGATHTLVSEAVSSLWVWWTLTSAIGWTDVMNTLLVAVRNQVRSFTRQPLQQ